MSYTVITPSAVHPTKGYSHAVRMGDLIFVSGQVAQDRSGQLVGKDDVRAQTEQVFSNLRAVLEEAGSGLDLIGKVTIFTTRVEYRPMIAEIRQKVFEKVGHFPASTYLVVSALAVPDWLVEVEAVATVK